MNIAKDVDGTIVTTDDAGNTKRYKYDKKRKAFRGITPDTADISALPNPNDIALFRQVRTMLALQSSSGTGRYRRLGLVKHPLE